MTDWQAEYEHALARLMQMEQEKAHLRLIAEGLRGALERLQTDLRRQAGEHYEDRIVRAAAIQAELVKYPLPPEQPQEPPEWPSREIAIGIDGEQRPYSHVEINS